MADFDVQPLAISSPPQPAFVTPYRPAVLVRNNGVHEAYASGLFRIYTAGKLIFTTSILSGLIQPKQTKEALGLEYWTPPAAGTFLILAYATTDKDQVTSNDNLAPVTITVAGTPPPPPPGVTPHAAQHEENAADELDLDGLKGRLADAQTPAGHKASHMVGGSDLLNVEGLAGTLLDGQPIQDHNQSHQDGGDDELNVEDLRGVLFNKQKPLPHANEAHVPDYATESDFSAHTSFPTAHENRRNVAGGFCGLGTDALVPTGNLAPEPSVQATHFLKVDKTWTQAQELAEKGQAAGYPELDEFSHVPKDQLGTENASPPEPSDLVLYSDSTWRVPVTAAHNSSHENGGDDEISLAGLSGRAASFQYTDYFQDVSINVQIEHDSAETAFLTYAGPVASWHSQAGYDINHVGEANMAAATTGTLTFILRVAGNQIASVAYLMLAAKTYYINVRVHLWNVAGQVKAFMTLIATNNDATPGQAVRMSTTLGSFALPSVPATVALSAIWSGASHDTHYHEWTTRLQTDGLLANPN